MDHIVNAQRVDIPCRDIEVHLILFADNRGNQAHLFQIINGIPNHSKRQVKRSSNRLRRDRSRFINKMVDDLIHHHNQCLFVVFVAHLTSLLFVFKFSYVLIGKRKFSPE